jgi:Uma2 family endonuclease
VYTIDRVPTTLDGYIAEDFWVPPDIAVEIASPGQSANQMTTRAQTLTGLGVRVVLVVEPHLRRVRVARPGQPVVSYQGDDVVTIEDVLPASPSSSATCSPRSRSESPPDSCLLGQP